MEVTKAALWRRLFGADLSPTLVSTLFYVDVQARLVKLTGGGWVRDAGDKMYASGAEPEVVALLVEAAKAKGWQAVRVWGSPEFIAECRRQFEAAGIPVSVDETPPRMIAPHDEPTRLPAPMRTEDIAAQLRRRIEYADRQLEDIRKPAPSGKDVVAAEAAERAADTAWRAALDKEEAARIAREQAERAAAQAGFFARARTRRAVQEAEALFESAEDAAKEAGATLRKLRLRLADIQKEAKNRDRRRRAKLEPEERNAEARRRFALECLQTLEQQPDLAADGVDAVERATEERLAQAEAQAADRAQFEAGAGSTIKF